MKTIAKPNTFALVSFNRPKRTPEQEVQHLREMFDLNNPVTHSAVCSALGQRVKVCNEVEKPYWTEVLNDIKSLSI